MGSSVFIRCFVFEIIENNVQISGYKIIRNTYPNVDSSYVRETIDQGQNRRDSELDFGISCSEISTSKKQIRDRINYLLRI